MKITKISSRKSNQTTRTFLSIMSIALLSGAGCGENSKTPGEKAKAVTDAVVNKTEDVKDAVVGALPTRAETEAKFEEQSAALKKEIEALEAKMKDETIPEVKAANKARIDRLKVSMAEANEKIADLKKSAEAEWNAKKEATTAALEKAKARVDSAIEREKLKEQVSEKLAKIEAKIESLKEDAARETAEAKAKLEDDRAKLEEKYEALKDDYNRFQESTEEKWEDFKDGFQKAFKELSETFKGWFD